MPKSLNSIEQEFWNAYVRTLPKEERPDNAKVEASFAGNPEITDGLIALYLEGRKHAGSSILEDFTTSGDRIPQVGDYWIALGSNGKPRCILKTVKTVLNRFGDIPLEVAKAEGEGDLSIEYWRRIHSNLYTPHLEKWGVKSLDEATVITEYFEVVYKEEVAVKFS